MAIRVPRGYDVARPYYNEYCEGKRPVAGALAKEAWTGLAHVRVDEMHNDPIVIEPGTLVGMITGGAPLGAGKLCPAILGTGIWTVTGGALGTPAVFFSNFEEPQLIQVGGTNTFGLPSASGNHAVGRVRPLGVCYQPVYSFILQARYTNYTRNTAVGILTDYVIQVPAVNSDEWLLEAGDTVILGTGRRHGISFSPPSPTIATHASGTHLAGRYARAQSYPNLADLNDRTVGRCLRRVKLGVGGGSTSQGDVLVDKLTDFTINATFDSEMAYLSKIQTVPGLNLTGSGTKGVPGFYLGARADANKEYWGLTLLIRL